MQPETADPDIAPAAEAGSGGPDRPVIGLADALVQSALLHAVRAASARAGGAPAARAGLRLVAVPHSVRLSAGRASHRFRFALLLARRVARSLREDGPAGLVRRAARRTARPAQDASAPTPTQHASQHPPAPQPHSAITARLTPRVLIAAELSIPQCAKYRVWQKQQEFLSLGIACTVIDWHRIHDVRSALQTHALLILYRVPGFDDILALIDDARRLGVPTLWEVDDLIFDVPIYANNSNLRSLEPKLRKELLDGVALYRGAMLAADATIASTPRLAALMREATGRDAHLVENALDEQTSRFAVRNRHDIQAEPGRPVTIVYGSGTKTHDADFAEAAPAIARAMDLDPNLRLRIIGELDCGLVLERFDDRIERCAGTHFEAYLAMVAECDIAIAPLEPTVFNDAKSNIKLIEAAILGLPSICSPRETFRDAVTHGQDGFLADTEEEWLEALTTLASDGALRARIGAASRDRILARYDQRRIARTELASVVALMPPARRARLRILVVNVFFAPRSFGGATIIAEEMAVRLDARPDTEVFVFTTRAEGAPYTLDRHVARGLPVFTVAVPGHRDDILDFDDPEMARVFDDVLDAVRPDLVHFHSVQTQGAGLLRACQMRGVAYIVTLHDAWWLCTRQFMVRADNTYCFQRTIDLKVCEACVPHAHHLPARLDILLQALSGASLILSPSASHLALYAANGLPPDRLRVNRNGIRPPARPHRAGPGGSPLRFGYVGGNERLKGVELIRAAFSGLGRSDWRLVLVDNQLNLGTARRSLEPHAWRLDGDVQIVPAYRQDTADAFFDGIDVLLFPSQWKESFGLTVREALARDIWVIATDCGGGAEQVADGVNGTVIPLGNDPEPLRDAIANLLARPDAIRANRNPHRDDIVTLDQQADELAGLIASISPRDIPAQAGP